MTKREMVEEMLGDVKFSVNNERVIKNRCENTKERIEEVYNHFLTTEKTREDRIFCVNLLVRF